MDIKYPNITVPLVGEDGNAYSILARVRRALSRNGVDYDEIDKFTDEATRGDYDELLQTVMNWVNVE